MLYDSYNLGQMIYQESYGPYYKLGCVVRMVVDSILLHAERGPNDHRKGASLFIYTHSFDFGTPKTENFTESQQKNGNLGYT